MATNIAIHAAGRDRCRSALAWGHLNGVLWGMGNALTSGSLVTYLTLDLGAKDLDLSLLLACQSLAGLLRIVVPALIDRWGSARRTCLALTTAAYLLIVWLPIATVVGSPLRHVPQVPAIIALLCVHQLLEASGTVAMWAWWSDVIPRRIRGRFLARRNIWQLAAIIPTAWLSGALIDYWKREHAGSLPLGYAVVTGLGAILLLASLVPLWRMPERIARRSGSASTPATQPATPGASMIAPLLSGVFWPVLLFGCTFSLVNGLTQTAQNVYPKQVLAIPLAQQALFVALLRFGQIGYSAWVGPFSDRFGNRPVLIVSQLTQALGMLCLVLARPAQPEWLWGTWILWSAYAGINIGIPNVLMKLAPRGETAAWFGIYYSLSALCNAAGTIAGGWLLSELRKTFGLESLGWLQLDLFAYLFLAGWIARSLTAGWLLLLDEPGAWSWRQILLRGRVGKQRPIDAEA